MMMIKEHLRVRNVVEWDSPLLSNSLARNVVFAVVAVSKARIPRSRGQHSKRYRL